VSAPARSNSASRLIDPPFKAAKVLPKPSLVQSAALSGEDIGRGIEKYPSTVDTSLSMLAPIQMAKVHHVLPPRFRTTMYQFPKRSTKFVLLKLQLIHDSSEHGVPIVPNMAHPLAEEFYRGKEVPLS
jgi:hypothetical protein